MGMYPGGNIVRITPTCDTATDTAGDIIFDTLEIPNAVSSRGGVSFLRNISIVNYNDTDSDMDLIFMQVKTNLGTEGGAIDVADSVVASSKLIGAVFVDWNDSAIDLINGQFASVGPSTASGTARLTSELPILIQAVGGSTSIYFTAIDRAGSISFAADGLEFIFHFEYIG